MSEPYWIVKVAPTERDGPETPPVGFVMLWQHSGLPPAGCVRADGREYRQDEIPAYAARMGCPRLLVHGKTLPPWSNVRAWIRWKRGYVRVPNFRAHLVHTFRGA